MTPNSAFGRASGVLDLPGIPFIGAKIVLSWPINPIEIIVIEGFSGHLEVETVLFSPGSSNANVLVGLEDVTVPTELEGKKLLEFLNKGFGLSGEEY